MALTRLECLCERKGKGASDSAFCALFNPRERPGFLSLAGSASARDSIGGQVASKLALEHFVEGIIEFFHSLPERTRDRETEIVATENLQSIEAAFKRANSSVYTFGHKLAAGGRMAAELLGAVLQDNVVSVGRVGSGAAYLCRGAELYPFFDAAPEDSTEGGSYVGIASVVSVQLSSVRVEPDDVLLFFSSPLGDEDVNKVFGVMDEIAKGSTLTCEDWLGRSQQAGESAEFSAIVQVGPDVIYLEEEWEG